MNKLIAIAFTLSFLILTSITPQPGFAQLLPASEESSESNTQAGGEVSGFTFVLPGKNGEKQCVIRGDTANFIGNDVIEIINVKTQVFRKGESDVFITSKKGEFNKATREVTTDEDVKIKSNEMLITGTGLRWTPNVEKAQLHKKVSVTIYSKPKGMNL